MAAADFSVTPVRLKVVDFVKYMNAQSVIMVKKGNPEKLTKTLDLCGKRISVYTASSQEEVDLPAITAQCTAAHKPAVKVLSFPSEQNCIQAVATGRVDAEIDDSSVAGYQVQLQPGVLETVPSIPFTKSPVGFPFPAGSQQLEDAIVAAVNHLISDGSYGRIMAKWGAQQVAIPKAELQTRGSA
jgi:polar amino acid transport system substrate-binding protein